MPTTARWAEEGVSADPLTLSLIPPVTDAVDIDSHRQGTFTSMEFMDLLSPCRVVSARPVTSRSRTTKALWNILSQSGLRSNVVGWWPSKSARTDE